MASQQLPVVLITGGAQRLGAVLCEVFAQAGWHVLCHYHRSEQAARALQERLVAQGAHVDVCQADLACEQERVQLIAQACRLGALQALVNSASLFEADSGCDFMLTQARRQLEVNLIAPLDLARQMALELKRRPVERQHPTHTPCVVHVLDQKVYNLNPDYFSYTVSKLALERAVALQAQALAPDVRVCGIAPGLMLVSGQQTEDNFAAASHANLLRRPLQPLHVAQSCLFMCSNPAITGSTLCVDNGQHLVPLPRDIVFVVDELLARHTAGDAAHSM